MKAPPLLFGVTPGSCILEAFDDCLVRFVREMEHLKKRYPYSLARPIVTNNECQRCMKLDRLTSGIVKRANTVIDLISSISKCMANLQHTPVSRAYRSWLACGQQETLTTAQCGVNSQGVGRLTPVGQT
jgi:hypothetical protein